MLKIEISLEDRAPHGVMVEIHTPPGKTLSTSEVMAYLIFCDVLNHHMRDAYRAPRDFDCTAKSLRPYKAILTGRGQPQ